MVELTEQPLDPGELLRRVIQPAAGAGLLFVGCTREFTEGRRTRSLTYDAYRPLAQRELQRLEHEARQRWSLIDCQIVHRLGHVAPGQISVAVAVSAPHRAQAFQAGQWLIDELKRRVPIWKQEHWDDGTSEWIHPAPPECSTTIDMGNSSP